MIQPVPHRESREPLASSTELEAACQRAVHEAVIRNAQFGLPAVGCENGQITFWPPERVLAEIATTTNEGQLDS